MIKILACVALLADPALGQAVQRDSTLAKEKTIEELLENVIAEDGGSQALDVLEYERESLLLRSDLQIRSRAQIDSPQPDLRSPLGSPLKFYNRILFGVRGNGVDNPGLEGGLVAEKDAWERYSEVFAAGYLDVTIPAVGFRALLGDFVIESGKGLMFWRSSGIIKGGDVLRLGRPRETRLEPYRSTDENHFFRGIALETFLGPLRICGLYSDRRLNGSLDSSGVVTSLDTDGLFRTNSEIRSRWVVREVMAGGILSMNLTESLLATLKVSKVSLSHPLSLSRYKAFNGTRADMLSADFIWRTRTLTFSGEIARDLFGSVASSASLYAKPSDAIGIAVAGHVYPPSFNSLHGFGASESGIMEGESGAYVASTVRFLDWLRASVFYDVFVFSHRLLFRSEGNDLMVEGLIRFSPRWEMSMQFRRQNKPSETQVKVDGLNYTQDGRSTQERYRCSLLHMVSSSLRWQARIEGTVRTTPAGSRQTGCLVFQEMRWQVNPFLRVSARITAFRTDGYEARLYTYEPDVPGGFSNLPVWDSGVRTFFLAELSLTDAVRLSARYSRMYREPIAGYANDGPANERITVQWDAGF